MRHDLLHPRLRDHLMTANGGMHAVPAPVRGTGLGGQALEALLQRHIYRVVVPCRALHLTLERTQQADPCFLVLFARADRHHKGLHQHKQSLRIDGKHLIKQHAVDAGIARRIRA